MNQPSRGESYYLASSLIHNASTFLILRETPQSTTPNSYCYDNVGNITYNDYGNPTVNSINQAGELTDSYNPGSGNNPCGSLTYGTSNSNYTYNSLGDRTQLNDGSYLFNYGYNTIGELTSYSFLSTNNFYYSYNHLLLAGINSNTGATQQLTYDNGNSNILFDSTYDYIYGPTNIPIEQVNVTEPYSAASSGSSGATDNPNYMYYSPTATMTGYMIANTIGNLDNAYYYGPYGNLNSGTVGSSFGYAGQYIGDQNQYSTTTNPLYSGLVYMKNRYYDPATGVFVSQDPLINQTNQAYVYAGDNPVSNFDPSGECPGGLSISNWACEFDNGNWLNLVAQSPNGQVRVSRKQASGLLVVNGFSQEDARNFVASFNWSRPVLVMAGTQLSAYYRYTGSNKKVEMRPFGIPQLYTSSAKAIAELDLKKNINSAKYAWLIGIDRDTPILYGYIKNSAHGMGIQFLVPEFANAIQIAAGPVPISQSKTLTNQYQQLNPPQGGFNNVAFTYSVSGVLGCLIS